MVKVIETEYGIASRSDNEIFINRRLNKYPELKDAIIDHEMHHSFGYSFDDLTMEFGIPQLDGFKLQYYKFILTNPSTWTEYSPIWIQNKEIKLSPTMLFFWISTILFFWIIFKLI
jgi:hypothetical protein